MSSRLTPSPRYTIEQLFAATAAGLHAMIGLAAVWIATTYYPTVAALVLVFTGLLVGAELKEFWWDLTREPGATIIGGIQDLLEYQLGAAVALAVLVATHRFA